MSGILEKLAGNKTIANLAFKQIRKYIKNDNISFIAIFVDDKGDIAAKEYKEPMAIIRQQDYEFMINKIKKYEENPQILPYEL